MRNKERNCTPVDHHNLQGIDREWTWSRVFPWKVDALLRVIVSACINSFNPKSNSFQMMMKKINLWSRFARCKQRTFAWTAKRRRHIDGANATGTVCSSGKVCCIVTNIAVDIDPKKMDPCYDNTNQRYCEVPPSCCDGIHGLVGVYCPSFTKLSRAKVNMSLWQDLSPAYCELQIRHSLILDCN